MATLGETLLAQFDAEARAGFPNLRGTSVSGTVPVSQGLLDEVIAGVSGKFAVELESGNRVRVRVLGFPAASATIVGIDSSLTLTLRFGGFSKYLLGLTSFKMPPHSRRVGDDLLIDIGQVPAVAAWRHVWRYATFHVVTSLGFLYVNFNLKVS